MPPSLRALAGDSPLMRTRPASGLIIPMIALNRVDFPEPFMPIRPQIRAVSRVSDAESSASTSP